MAIQCPACGEMSARHQVARAEYPSIAPQMVGGIASACVFELSRKRRFRCERCGELFYSHSGGARLLLALWGLFLGSLAFGIWGTLLASAAFSASWGLTLPPHDLGPSTGGGSRGGRVVVR